MDVLTICVSGLSVFVRILCLNSRPVKWRHTRLSANDTGDNEMIPESVHRSPGIILQLRKIPENSS